MDQYLLIPFLVGWTSIYQLFWCSPGVHGFDTLPCINYQPLISTNIWSFPAYHLPVPQFSITKATSVMGNLRGFSAVKICGDFRLWDEKTMKKTWKKPWKNHEKRRFHARLWTWNEERSMFFWHANGLEVCSKQVEAVNMIFGILGDDSP